MSKRLLDFGAGVETSIPYYQKHLSGTDVVCLDVSRKSLDIGRQRFGSQAEFAHFDDVTIPFPDASFDVLFAACVFHHILHSEHGGLLSEAARILREGGIAVIYEHNPWNPLTVHTVNTCPFDENAKLIAGPAAVKRLQLAGFSAIELRYRVYFPRALKERSRASALLRSLLAGKALNRRFDRRHTTPTPIYQLPSTIQLSHKDN